MSWDNEDRRQRQPPIMPIGQPPPPQLRDPRPPPDPTKARKIAIGYYVVICAIFGFPALVALAYGSGMAFVFGFVFVVLAIIPVFNRRRR